MQSPLPIIRKDSVLPQALTTTRRTSSSSSSTAAGTLLDPTHLLQQSRWIRDILDPLAAQHGPDALSADDVLQLDEFLRTLLHHSASSSRPHLTRETLIAARLHLAILAISGPATRWPRRLIERAEALREAWERRFGDGVPLKRWRTLLYEPGGRLSGISEAGEEVRMGGAEKMLAGWRRGGAEAREKMGGAFSRRVGDLGFVAGE